jgi:hypothetical protein
MVAVAVAVHMLLGLLVNLEEVDNFMEEPDTLILVQQVVVRVPVPQVKMEL